MRVTVVLFTRDLRVHDNPALATACRVAERVVPLFVRDPSIHLLPRREAFLRDCLADLRGSLLRRGGDLVERRGDPVAEAMRVASLVGAEGLAVVGDASGYARRRERRLAAACAEQRIALRVFPGVTVVPPGELRPAGRDHYRVFTPYWRAWQAARRRDVEDAPDRVRLPDGLPAEWLQSREAQAADRGETAGRRRLAAWLHRLGEYGEERDRLAVDGTSRLSPYLHLGCVSAATVAARVDGREGAEPFLRQLCWRDFYHQVLWAFPDLPRRAYRRGAVEDWRAEGDELDAWRAGQTGVPVVDAGMRQLAAEGWMHNRARLITAAYLTKGLGLDWRAGAEHFFDLLLDADVANNSGNWQWVAGTGNDTRPYRRFNPVRQAERFDPEGCYVRRYVPELAAVPGKAVHQPWRLPQERRRGLAYPDPIG